VRDGRIHRTKTDPATAAATRPPGRSNHRRLALGGVLLMAALTAAACGSSTRAATSPSGSGPSASSPSATAPATDPVASTDTVKTATVGSVGTILIDSSGRSLYLYTADKQKATTCTGACAKAWPPLVVSGTPVAGSGVKSSMLGTIKDPDGKTQVTYNHWPLYTFAGASGQVKGEGVEGSWFAVTAAGTEAKAATATPPTTVKKKSGSAGSTGY
jgi:predicted lipoprotein with Yx(FWY)xxD motif